MGGKLTFMIHQNAVSTAGRESEFERLTSFCCVLGGVVC
jgi:hypothetical protein